MRLVRIIGALALATSSGLTPAAALEIVPTFDATITSSPNAANIKAGINTAISTIDALYGNPIQVNIQFGLGGVSNGGSESTYDKILIPYNQYVAQLNANFAANPSNTALATAVQHINDGIGANQKDVVLTMANARALGFQTPSSNSFINIAPGFNFTSGGMMQPAGVSIIEHEINEVLGGGGAGAQFVRYSPPYYGSLDFYRWSPVGSGPPVFTFSDPRLIDGFDSGAEAYFSIDGGQTIIAYFNNTGGGDYSDFDNAHGCLIQSALICDSPERYTINSPEYTMMEAIGYNPFGSSGIAEAVPEPSSWAMLLIGFTGVGLMAFGKRRQIAST